MDIISTTFNIHVMLIKLCIIIIDRGIQMINMLKDIFEVIPSNSYFNKFDL